MDYTIIGLGANLAARLQSIAEPGRIGSSIADALNYQFGFEVSKTWFYQLLSRACVPLIIFGGLAAFGSWARSEDKDEVKI